MKRGCRHPINAIGPSFVLPRVERQRVGLNGFAVAGNRGAVGVLHIERERAVPRRWPEPVFAL